jgi:Tol biopolymer transport system component
MLTVLKLSVIYELAWSYESQQIAFTFDEIPGDKSSLYVINLAGYGLTKLTNNQDLNASNPVGQPQ